MGPFPRSPKCFKYLLVVADCFRKYTWLCPMREATAKCMAKFLEHHVFICDNGQQLAGKTFKKLIDYY